MNYQSFSDLEKQYLNVGGSLDYDYNEKYGNLHVLLSGDGKGLPKDDPSFRLGDTRARIEQHIDIAEHHLMDDGSYTEIKLSDFDLLERILDFIGFNGSCIEYRELRKIVKSRTVRDGEITCLILYFFVEDLLKILKLNNPWVRLAGKDENDPYYDEVLAHIEEYRRELDAETVQ